MFFKNHSQFNFATFFVLNLRCDVLMVVMVAGINVDFGVFEVWTSKSFKIGLLKTRVVRIYHPVIVKIVAHQKYTVKFHIPKVQILKITSQNQDSSLTFSQLCS